MTGLATRSPNIWTVAARVHRKRQAEAIELFICDALIQLASPPQGDAPLPCDARP